MEQNFQDFVWELFTRVGIPAHRYNASIQNFSWMDRGLRQDILGMTSQTEQVNRRLSSYEDATVYYETDIFLCNYVAMKLPSGEFVLVGPILFDRMTQQRFEELFQHLSLPEKLRQPLQDYYRSLKYSPLQGSFEQIINLWADYLYGKDCYRVVRNDAHSLQELREFHFDCLRTSETPQLGLQIIERQYNLENALSRAVAAGNEALALDCIAGLQENMLPLHPSNELSHIKNYAISINMLLKKVAEQAGVHPIHSDSCYNQNIRYIELMSSGEQCRNFARKIAQGYCRVVQKYNVKGYTLPIQKAIVYINANPSSDLSLKVLAERINVNASYLSSLFKKEVGVSLTEYVNQCRINHAKLLLLTTAMPTKSIALQCGISDTYYFSRLFKRYAGMTPRAFRERGFKELFPELVELDRQKPKPLESQKEAEK